MAAVKKKREEKEKVPPRELSPPPRGDGFNFRLKKHQPPHRWPRSCLHSRAHPSIHLRDTFLPRARGFTHAMSRKILRVNIRNRARRLSRRKNDRKLHPYKRRNVCPIYLLHILPSVLSFSLSVEHNNNSLLTRETIANDFFHENSNKKDSRNNLRLCDVEV